MKCLKNKRGEGTYIYLCVIVLFITMIMSVLITYLSITAQISAQKRELRAKLDGYTSEYATKAFNAIKQGDRYDRHIDFDAYQEGCLSALGFDSTGICRYEKDCTLRNGSVALYRGDGFGLTVSYTASIPIRWNRRIVTTVSIPVTISSYFKTK